MKKGEGSMSGIAFLLVLAFIAAVGGVYFFIERENDSYSSLVNEIKSYKVELNSMREEISKLKADIDVSIKTCSDLYSSTRDNLTHTTNVVNEKDNTLKKINQEIDILKVRQTTMDKSISSLKFPKQLSVKIDDIVKMEVIKKNVVPTTLTNNKPAQQTIIQPVKKEIK